MIPLFTKMIKRIRSFFSNPKNHKEMAKTPVTLRVDGFTDREVTMVTYAFNQATDKEGQMTGIPRGGKITIRVKALNDGNPDLLHWMIQQALPKNGSIEFLDTKTNARMKEIRFTDAYCVDFREYWEDQTGDKDVAHYEEIVISCRKITNGPVEYTNDWA